MNDTPRDAAPWPMPPSNAAVRRAGRAKTLVFTLGGAVFGAGVGMLVGKLAKSAGGAPLRELVQMDLWTLALLPAMWLLVVLVHEFGHLLGGRLAGMRPLMLFAGPLHFDFGADRLRLKRNRVAGTFGGLAACLPAAGTTRSGFAMLVAGGPLASLLLAVLAAGSGLAIGGWVGGALVATGAMSLLIAAATLIPLRAGGYMSDGGQLVGLARNDAETTARLSLSTLMAHSASGVRPRDWDPGLLASATPDTDEPNLRLVAALLRAGHHEDHGRRDAADAEFRRVAGIIADPAQTAIADGMRRAVAVSLAAWIATEHDDPGTARAWLEASRGGFSVAAVSLHAEAAVRAAEGHRDEARQLLDAARAALPQVRDRGSAIVLSDAIDRLAGRLQDAEGPRP
jgi:hypothetical protein